MLRHLLDVVAEFILMVVTVKERYASTAVAALVPAIRNGDG